MRGFRSSPSFAAALVAALTVAPLAEGQVRRDSVADTAGKARATVIPGPSYGSQGLKRAILGSGWRDVWVTPVSAPLFDLDTYAGGLKIDKRGGGFQTVTLHLSEQNGWREYRFRSVNKYPMLRMPPALAGTTIGRIIQDQTGNLFPAAPLVIPPFMVAVDALHTGAELYVMPDHPRLGEHRTMFAGMLGTVEMKGEEAPDDKPGFAGSTKVKETEDFFKELDKSQANRVDEREFLTIRLIDFLINDTDRTPDNIDWARFGEDSNYLWRPIARDRDRAFTAGSGILNALVIRRIYPKFTPFNDKFSLRGLTQSSYFFDRRLLQRLTSRDFAEVAAVVQRKMSDSVIEAGIAALPAEWRQRTTVAEDLRSTLRARREGLAAFTMRFYEDLARQPDVHLTGDDERADIVRHPDGSVTLTVPSRRAPVVVASSEVRNPAGGATRTMAGTLDLPGKPFFQRTFLPGETKEIRIYLGGGSDTAVVRGHMNDEIMLRVIGGDGDDVLADSAGGGATALYDAEGDDQFITAQGTQVSRKPWSAPDPAFGFTVGGAWKPDWGGRAGWSPVAKYAEGNGLVVGFGPRFKRYGFRRLPYQWTAGAAVLVGTRNGRLGVVGDADYRAENSPMGLTVMARATQLEAFRFYGYGNDTPDLGRELSLVQQTVLSIEPAVFWQLGWRAREKRGDLLVPEDSVESFRPMAGKLSFGPVVTWTNPDPSLGSALTTTGVRGSSSFGQTGLRFIADLDGSNQDPVPTSGWRLRASAASYTPASFRGFFHTASATAATYLPLGLGETNLAFRLGGSLASGDFPAQYAATIGGSPTVRGYRSRRFSGDRAASASTELRVPVGTLNFLVRSQVGVFALGDVGRVWYGGESDGAWHTGVGGGVWAAALGKAVTFTYARGEQNRFYLKTGLAF